MQIPVMGGIEATQIIHISKPFKAAELAAKLVAAAPSQA